MAQRYVYEYDVKPEGLAKIAVQERYNAQYNDKAVFQGQAISVEDVSGAITLIKFRPGG